MLKDIYHGSDKIIREPIYGVGKAYNDYGRGFYCTEDIEMAKEWGANPHNNGFANHYQIDDKNLITLNLNDRKYSILHWLNLLLQNREFSTSSGVALEAKQYLHDNFMLDISEFDVVKGYRADDSYFSFAQDFINGTISYRQLSNALYLGNLGQQFVLISRKAFEAVRFVDYEIAESEIWFTRKKQRDTEARREYFDLERNKRRPNDIYILQMIDEEMKADDSRLR